MLKVPLTSLTEACRGLRQELRGRRGIQRPRAGIQRRFSGDSAAIQRLVFSTFLESAWLISCSRCSYAWHATSADRSSSNSAQEGSLGRAGWACGLAGGLGAAASPGGRASVAVDNGCWGPGPAAGGPVARSAGSRCPSPFGYDPRARRGLPADVFTDPFLGVCRKQIRRTFPHTFTNGDSSHTSLTYT